MGRQNTVNFEVYYAIRPDVEFKDPRWKGLEVLVYVPERKTFGHLKSSCVWEGKKDPKCIQDIKVVDNDAVTYKDDVIFGFNKFVQADLVTYEELNRIRDELEKKGAWEDPIDLAFID
jgi:hypothetical protein